MISRIPEVDALADLLADRVLGCPPRLFGARLVAIDGPAGSGKTTLAAALDRSLRVRLEDRLSDRLGDRLGDRPGDRLGEPGTQAGRPRVRRIHMDNLYPGWSGLEAGMATLASSVVAPMAAGDVGRYRRWDWHRDAFAEERVVEACDVLVVEGVGSGCRGVAEHLSLLVWVETPSDVRLERGLARDGAHLREHFLAFRAHEDAVLSRERTRERADVVVAGDVHPPTT